MINLFNKVIFYLKIIVLVISFSLTLYISFMIQDYYGNQVGTIISLFVPMLLMLLIFVISFFFDEGNKNIFFNIASFLSLLAIMIIALRTIFDKNMVTLAREKINYYFFQNQIKQIKILSYMIFLGNVLLIYNEKSKKGDV